MQDVDTILMINLCLFMSILNHFKLEPWKLAKILLNLQGLDAVIYITIRQQPKILDKLMAYLARKEEAVIFAPLTSKGFGANMHAPPGKINLWKLQSNMSLSQTLKSLEASSMDKELMLESILIQLVSYIMHANETHLFLQ